MALRAQDGERRFYWYRRPQRWMKLHWLYYVRLKKEDVELSNHSPLGVPFHYLKATSGALERAAHSKRKPRESVYRKAPVSDRVYKEPICTASAKYQETEDRPGESLQLPEEDRREQIKRVLDKNVCA